jgi:hypothetical protein
VVGCRLTAVFGFYEFHARNGVEVARRWSTID